MSSQSLTSAGLGRATPAAVLCILLAPAASAQFVDGDLYVTSVNHVIWRVDQSLNITAFANTLDGLNGPYGMAFTPDGTLLVANQNGNDILEFDSAGNGSVFLDASDGISGPSGPNCLAHDPAGDLYLLHESPSEVLLVPRDGATPYVFADSGDGLTFAGGMGFLSNGDLLIASNGSIYRVDPAGNSSLFDSPACAWSLVIRNNDDVYVTCNGGDIHRYVGGDPSQRVLLQQFPAMTTIPSLIFDPDHTVLLITSLTTGDLLAVDPDMGSWSQLLPPGSLGNPTSMAVFGEGTLPRIRQYGPGVAGAGGIVPSLWMTGNPVPNGAVVLESRDFVGGAYSALLVGLAPATLDALGGTLYVSLVPPRIFLFRTLPGAAGSPGLGDDGLGATLPNDPLLAGLHIYIQHLAFDPAAVNGISMSNGLDVYIGG